MLAPPVVRKRLAQNHPKPVRQVWHLVFWCESICTQAMLATTYITVVIVFIHMCIDTHTRVICSSSSGSNSDRAYSVASSYSSNSILMHHMSILYTRHQYMCRSDVYVSGDARPALGIAGAFALVARLPAMASVRGCAATCCTPTSTTTTCC